MSDKLKKLARALAAKRGISYQAALNLLTRKKDGDTGSAVTPPEEVTAGDNAAGPASVSPEVEEIMRLLSNRPHEPDCPLHGGGGDENGSLRCECLGIDYSLPLLDGDDY